MTDNTYSRPTGRKFIIDNLKGGEMVFTFPDHDEWSVWTEYQDVEDDELFYVSDHEDYTLVAEEFGEIPEEYHLEFDDCPEDGEQVVIGESSTGGADPYAVNRLSCGHRVACFGPGEPNVIL